MTAVNDLTFDFDFGGEDRAKLLAEARRTVGSLSSELVGKGKTPGSSKAASRLLKQLNQEVAEFSVFPEVLELKEKHFAEHGLPVPLRFKDLSKQYKFYWVHFPIKLYPLEGMHFNRLKCAVEFNPGITEGYLRPRAHSILPNKKFKQLLEFSDSLELRIGENFEFEVASPGTAGVNVREAGKLGLVVGPFTYRLKRAQLNHSAPGSEKVFWTLDDAELFQEEDAPTFIVITQVPKTVDRVQIAAALQAYHGFNLLAATLGEAINYFRERLATFFHKGAPVQDTHVWDITPSL